MSIRPVRRTREIVTDFPSVAAFENLLKVNPGLVIVKFGATWCGPCKAIKPLIDAFFLTSPQNVVCADIDIDQCPQLYNLLKNKRMIQGVPTVMAWYKGNLRTIPPDDAVVGADAHKLELFFERCSTHANSIRI